jgi:hypothetical protein
MTNADWLRSLSKEQLVQLIGDYSKNWLALDGVWFQAVERRLGMDEADACDAEAWRRFTEIEAARIKRFLALPERAGLEGLARALACRFYGSINEYDLTFPEPGKLVFRNVDCRVQTARKRKGMEFHPCKSVGLIEYTGFAKVIDDRIRCRCLSCYPEVTDPSVCCAWEFTLEAEAAR